MNNNIRNKERKEKEEIKIIQELKTNHNNNGTKINYKFKRTKKLNCFCECWIVLLLFIFIIGVISVLSYLGSDINYYLKLYKEFDEAEANIRQKYEPEEVSFIHLMVFLGMGSYKRQEECQFMVYPLYDIYKDQVNLIFEELSHHSFWKLVRDLCFNTYKLKIIQNSMVEEARRAKKQIDTIEYDSIKAEQFCKYLYSKEDQTKSRDDIINLFVDMRYFIFDDSFIHELIKFYSYIFILLIISIPIKCIINQKEKTYQQLQEDN